MSPVALALLLAAAVLHTGWNLLVKRARQRLVFAWWSLAVGAIAFLPILLAGVPIPARIWPYAMASALLEGLYFGSLAAAYGAGDFSVIYPIARGAAPAFLAVWSVVFLGQRLQPAGIAGLAVIVAGLLVIAGAGNRGGGAARVSRAGIGLALLTALAISGYSAIDAAAIRILRPAPYTALVFALSTLVAAPLVVQRYGWTAVADEWVASWPRIAAVGFLSGVAYAMVLAAYSIAPVAYAGAVREVSVVLAALAGWLFLKEGFGLRRTAGAVLVFAGIAGLAALGR
ncbi:MAG TPA: DMT family transporter [Thermoanaerobaculia bacterium]